MKRRLKIFEQILVIFFIAVFLPLCVTTLIVINVNQHAVRKELIYSSRITSESIYHKILSKIQEKKNSIVYISNALEFIESTEAQKKYLNSVLHESSSINNFEILDINDLKDSKGKNLQDVEISSNNDKKVFTLLRKIKNNKYLKETISLNILGNEVFEQFQDEKRQIYIIDKNKNILMSNNNENIEYFNEIKSFLPQDYEPGIPVVFGESKNLPNVFLKIKKPDWSVIIATPKDMIHYSITKARAKIIIAFAVATFSIIIIGVWYSLSLKRNIRQLFKAIIAIGKGNYSRRVRLIKDFFTPYEVIFLTNEFNNMAQKVEDSYKEIKDANKKLAKIDEMKSTIIDTVSHEFRTPLTSIKGYTSRLLRSDIVLCNELKIKSLKVIKRQTERLSRLVEDLLVIPDIESNLIRIFPKPLNLKDVFELSLTHVSPKENKNIIINIDENFPLIYADPDRVEQVILNLIDNAVKYAKEDSEIKIYADHNNDNSVIKIHNECEPIALEDLNSLFKKFSRVDSHLTRTTRGIGLGLFITKGLVESMRGSVALCAQSGFEVCFTLPLYKEKE